MSTTSSRRFTPAAPIAIEKSGVGTHIEGTAEDGGTLRCAVVVTNPGH